MGSRKIKRCVCVLCIACGGFNFVFFFKKKKKKDEQNKMFVMFDFVKSSRSMKKKSVRVEHADQLLKACKYKRR